MLIGPDNLSKKDYLACTKNSSQNERGSTQRGLGYDPDNRLASQKELQMGCKRLYHKAGYRARDIYLCAQESARQALINVMVACGNVTRMANHSMALVTINSLGEVVCGMDMKRSKQHHRHINQQYHPRKHLLPGCDAIMC